MFIMIFDYLRYNNTGVFALPSKRENFGSRLGFVMATVGSAVGLGNVWRFPTVVAENGGGAFVLLYLAMILLIGLPTMIAELTLGRAGSRNIVGVFKNLSPRRQKWWLIGLLPLLATFMVLSFYAVVAGWSILYVASSLLGITAGLSAEGLEELFASLSGSYLYPFMGQIFFIAVTVGIVVVGVRKGIERWVKVLMPGIFILLLVLFVRTLFLDGALEGLVWFFRPDFGGLSVNTALQAVGQVFFSFSLGMGAIITYGSYLARDADIPLNSLYISAADLGVAILSGLIVIPTLFAFGISPQTGPGLIFITLPAIFNTLPWSALWTVIFFTLLTFAALTSAVSLLEVMVAYLIEERNWPRAFSAAGAGFIVFIASIPAALSQGPVKSLRLAGLDFFSFLDFTASNILLPLGGLLIIIFIGWVWGTARAGAEISSGGSPFRWFLPWSVLVRIVVPLAIAYILVSGLFF